MIRLVIISFAAFALYMAAVMHINRQLKGSLVPPSISENFYLYEEIGKGLGWIFFGWCTLLGISVMAVMFDLSEGKWYQFIPLFAGVGLVFVGCAPRFKGSDREMHQAGALMCALSASLWCLLSGYWPVIVSSMVASFSISLFNWKNRIFWWELAIFMATYIILFLKTSGE